MRKRLEDMNLIDNYLMNCVASYPKVGEACCRRILSVLLQREIGKVHITAQRIIPGANTDLRGIRMDVEVEEITENTGKETVANVYDIEPHTAKDMNFFRHNRFYQAKIDSRHMKSGDNDFNNMPNLFVVTITNFDIFGKDRMIYTFRNRCDEVPELDYPDGLLFVYFNTKGKNGGSKSIENMLRYIQESNHTNVVDDATREIDKYVETVKTDPKLKEDYMTLGYYIDKEKAEEELRLLIEKVIKKINKDKPVSVIADELEEDEARIAAVCSVAEKYAPDYDLEKILQELTETAELKE